MFDLLLADFASANCMREVDAAVNSRKPLLLVLEEDALHGGQSLAQSLSECPPHLQDSVFGPPTARRTDAIPWMRLPAFQLESLRLIAVQLLAATPVDRSVLSDVRVRGELRTSNLAFARPHLLFFDECNLGARDATLEISEAVHHVAPKAAELVSSRKSKKRRSIIVIAGAHARRSIVAMVGRAALLKSLSNNGGARGTTSHVFQGLSASDVSDGHATFLLYLNAQTWLEQDQSGRASGSALARDDSPLAQAVHSAIDGGVPIALVHERAAEKGGCPFSYFFQTTPRALVERGLYNTLADPWFNGTHRMISIRITAQRMGAKKAMTTLPQSLFKRKHHQFDEPHTTAVQPRGTTTVQTKSWRASPDTESNLAHDDRQMTI